MFRTSFEVRKGALWTSRMGLVMVDWWDVLSLTTTSIYIPSGSSPSQRPPCVYTTRPCYTYLSMLHVRIHPARDRWFLCIFRIRPWTFVPLPHLHSRYYIFLCHNLGNIFHHIFLVLEYFSPPQFLSPGFSFLLYVNISIYMFISYLRIFMIICQKIVSESRCIFYNFYSPHYLPGDQVDVAVPQEGFPPTLARWYKRIGLCLIVSLALSRMHESAMKGDDLWQHPVRLWSAIPGVQM